jgi:hypothetical protein
MTGYVRRNHDSCDPIARRSSELVKRVDAESRYEEKTEMPNIAGVLNDQIRRLAKREITSQTRSTRRLTAQFRRDIAAEAVSVCQPRTTGG